ncbi:MAG: tRNA-dihydrouridine synthase family protein [Clostridia bacterium]|nr:tRNA-dihydrouridine synthase family protein [Clostridia bacterium]
MIVYFAPMEGITDGVFRRVHHRLFGGIDVYGLPFHKLTQSLSLTTREKRDIDPEENRGLTVLPQALTRDPGQLVSWLEYVRACGYSRADLNLGCPSPTVTRRGRGSGMLRDLPALRAFFDRVFAGSLPVLLSVKTRIGYESPEEWPEILALLADYPFAHVTVHVRTMREQYTGGIHPEAFDLALAGGLPHPVYNGDLRTPEDVQSLVARCPGTEAVMIGRGLLADPALARRIRGGPAAGEEELRTWYTALYEGWRDRFHATLALGRIKKLMVWPVGDDLRKKRLLRRAEDIDGCIDAVLGKGETHGPR